ncbi:MAG: aspartate aminotransferase family protein [Candidatus Hodarchaeota archaeon]
MQEKTKIIGSERQKELIKMYAEYVCKPKAQFFKGVGLGMVQGERNRLMLKMLEGVRRNKPALELIDCRTSGGVFNLGHGHPEIIRALKDGIDAGLDIGDHHLISEQRALLAKKLANLLPGDISKTQYCVGGGEAVDLALKLGRGITKKKKIISAKSGYHGVTAAAVATGDPKFKEPFSWDLPGFQQVTFGEIDELRSAVDDDTACVIFETIPATGGILIPPEGYFQEVREICDEKGSLMISDEVQTGLGRTGHLWGIHGGLYESERVVPDIIVLAKGMSAGYCPLATCSYKPFIEEIFEEDPFIHISSTGGSELGCYVTRKMLDIVSQPSFLNHVLEMGKKFESRLEEFRNQYPTLINDTRGRGLMWGIEFVNDRYGLGYALKMIENGVFADYCGNKEDTVKVMPPLITSSEEVDEILSRLEIALSQLPLPT